MKIGLRITRNIIIAVLAIALINFLVLYSLNFPQMALFQIKRYFPLLLLLISGFGVQIGLYTYLKHKNVICGITTATSGGVSGISMILCCSHYLINFLPFISISTASFFSKYTLQILLFGIAANVIGIGIMLNKIRKTRRKNEFNK